MKSSLTSGRANILGIVLLVAPPVTSAGARVAVMTQNLYVGFDIEKYGADLVADPGNIVALTTEAYAHAVATDFPADDPGYTWGQDADLLNPMSQLSERLDLVLLRGAVTATSIDLVGEELDDRMPTGLWPSDHAGVLAVLVPEPGALALVSLCLRVLATKGVSGSCFPKAGSRQNSPPTTPQSILPLQQHSRAATLADL